MPRCSDCGTERPHLHKHHKIARSQGGGDEPGNLISICANCHVKRHGGQAGGTLRGFGANTPEANAKKAAASKRNWADPEWRAKVLEAQRKGRTEESEARRLRRSTESQRSPEGRKKRSEIAKRLMSDPERRQQISDSMKETRRNRFWSSGKQDSPHND